MRSPLRLHRSFSVELRILREAPAEIVKESWTSQGNDATSLVSETHTPHDPNDAGGIRGVVNRRDVHSCR